jgi:heme O synthase-like polyprenyltransferase
MNVRVSSIGTTDRSAIARSMLLRASDYLTLTKPRLMSLVVFTALVGLLSAQPPFIADKQVVAHFAVKTVMVQT